MPSFSVYGADGRRILHGVAEAHAREEAARITTETGEDLDVRADDEPAPDTASEPEAAEAPAAEETKTPTQRRRSRKQKS